MLQIQRVSQAQIHEGGKPSYVGEVFLFQMNNMVFPMVCLQMTEDQIAEKVSARTKELMLVAARNTFQNQGPGPLKVVPPTVPSKDPAGSPEGSPGHPDVLPGPVHSVGAESPTEPSKA